MTIWFLVILRMNKCTWIETTDIYPNLSDQNKFRLNEGKKIKDYFNSEIQERKIMNKKLCKYIAAFDCFDKSLIVSSVAGRKISIIFLRVLLEFLYIRCKI